MSNSKEKPNIELPQSAKDFLEYLSAIKNKSKDTAKGYECDLKIFFNFITTYKKKKKINNNFIKGITLKDLHAFVIDLAEEIIDKNGNKKCKNSEATRARKVACIKSYFNYLQYKAKLINYNPAFELESPKIPDKEIIYLDVNDSKHLLESVNKNDRNYKRNICILTVFLNTGLRASELCNLRIDMIKGEQMTIIGKGGRKRQIYLNEVCLKVIKDYLLDRDDTGTSEEDKKYLFLSERKQRIKKPTVQQLVKKHLGEADFDDRFHTHTLRASFCTNVYNKGVGIKTLQTLMGHSQMSTTQRYIGTDEESLKNAVKDIY